MTSITTSEQFDFDVRTKRLFATMLESMQATEKAVEAIIGTANGMRRNIAQSLLSLAEIEALFVDQTEGRRKSDALLYTLQTKFDDLIAKIATGTAALATDLAAKQGVHVEAIKQQAERVCTDRFIRDDEDGQGMVAGVEYVDARYMCEKLSLTGSPLSTKSFYRYLQDGSMPQHDTMSDPAGKGRPERLWVKSRADQAISEFRKGLRDKSNAKKGITALV